MTEHFLGKKLNLFFAEEGLSKNFFFAEEVLGNTIVLSRTSSARKIYQPRFGYLAWLPATKISYLGNARSYNVVAEHFLGKKKFLPRPSSAKNKFNFLPRKCSVITFPCRELPWQQHFLCRESSGQHNCFN